MLSRVTIIFLSGCALALSAWSQARLDILNQNLPLVDAHNCYPYDGQWTNRIERALSTGFPVSIEQDLTWYIDPATGQGRVVVSHAAKATGSDPALRAYFFDRVRPIVERALTENDRSHWPLIVLHFDFKENQAPLLHAVWHLLGEYEKWITTAPKLGDPHQLAALDVKPLLVVTEDSDLQEAVFFNKVAVGARLRLFGSAHTNQPRTKNKQELIHLAATLSPEQLLSEPPTNYRRWWNNSWYEVEEGGQPHAGAWTEAEDARLHSLVDHAHQLGYWIRFYTLDGFSPAQSQGWFQDYNFGSLQAVRLRWKAAIQAGVNFIATDQYEELAAFLREQKAAQRSEPSLRFSAEYLPSLPSADILTT